MNQYEEFLERYYHDDILYLAGEYPDKRSLSIQYGDIEKFNLDLADRVLTQPDLILQDLEKVLSNWDLPINLERFTPHVRISGVPKVRRRDLRNEHVGHLVALDGVVQRVTNVEPKILEAVFECRRCGFENRISQNGVFTEPFECEGDTCGRKGPFKHVIDRDTKIDFQKLRLQELPEDLRGGEKTQTIDVNLVDDLTGIVLPGNRVTITGTVRAVQRTSQNGKSVLLELSIDAVCVEVRDARESVVVTPEDRMRLHELAADPGIIDKLVDSFAPTVCGMRDEKEAMLCAAVSEGFGFRPDGTPQREYSHVLICTDPGMAKSNLKHALKAIKPEMVLSSGTGASTAGLTAAAVRDDFANGAWSIEAGVLPLADRAGAVIDEFDKLRKDELNKLNDALSNCQFEVSKAGIQLKLWARCSVIALMNPKRGRMDRGEPIIEQIEIPPDTLSRFDLVFVISDDVIRARDGAVADCILDAWTGAENAVSSAPFSVEDMQKYLACAASIQPDKKIPDGVRAAMRERFLLIRERSDTAAGRVAVTNRYLESLLRLTRAQAQLGLSREIRMEHFQRAVRLLDSSVYTIGVDERGQLDADVVASGKSASQREKILLIRKIITDLCKRHDGLAPLGEIVLEAADQGIDESPVETYLSLLKTEGIIIEPRNRFFKVV